MRPQNELPESYDSVEQRDYGKMRPMKILARLLVCITVWSVAANGQLYYNNCPPEGDAKSASVRALDRLKNRDTAPAPDQINKAVTLAALVQPRDDRGRWKVKNGAEIVGYVWDVKVGGVTRQIDPGRWDRSAHSASRGSTSLDLAYSCRITPH